jgi:nucleotide-binding universal stress UspA family protein
MKRLLVAYDSTEQANAALDVALQIARGQGASVIACYALHISAELGRVAAAFHYTPASAQRMLREDARAVLAEASSRALQAGATIETKLVDAPVVSGIVDCARRARAEMIVIGSHGRSGLPRLLLGSVAEGVMRQAHVPVLVVRTPAAAAARRKRKAKR